jgi:hypothetical protein
MNSMKFTPGAANNPGMGQQPQQVSLDASTLETFVCRNCKNKLFQSLIIIKRISPVNPANNTGKEMFAPMDVLVCTQCGEIPYEFGGKVLGQEAEKSNENNE